MYGRNLHGMMAGDDFTLDDVRELLEQDHWGMDELPDEAARATEERVATHHEILDAMTAAERGDPAALDGGDVERIAERAGVDARHVRELLALYRLMSKLPDFS